ncbi:MAG: helix-turn-helix transcriptional regulator [Lachnospiraceae bacterium]|nr:helix-turn-helix transcriptional regulator [Lachnospiraceae bacterium]
MDKLNIGSRLKEIRNDRDLSLEMVAKDVNRIYGTKISKGKLSKWEHDVNTPSLNDLSALVRYYNISLDYIIGTTDKKTPPHLW